MEHLIDLIEENEDWLIKRILAYAKARGYTKYTSTLEEAWRMSIAGLSTSLMDGLRQYDRIPELEPEDDFQGDALTSFGVIEAKRHRQRGIELSMFLGLMKYYKQCYIDLIIEKSPQKKSIENDRLFIERSFDRIEIAFCKEWACTGEDKRLQELQRTNRRITNEKNAYLTVFESLADPVIMLDKTDKIINLNYEAARLFNPTIVPGASYYRPHRDKTGHRSLIGKNVHEVFPWMGRILEEPVSETRGEKIFEVEPFIEGEKKYYEVKRSRMLDLSEKFTATLLTVRNVTDHKAAEEKLEWSRKNLANAQRIAHLGSWEMDIATGDSYWSDEFFRICGLEPGAIKPNAEFGMTVIHPDDRERAAKAVEEAISGGKEYKIEKRIVRPDGSVRDVLSQGEVIFDEQNRPVKIVGSFLDITDRKRIEEDLRKAKEAAEAASLAKSQFLSTMSHEIRTPLNAVIGMAEVLSETSLNIEQHQFLRILSTAGEDLMALINDILDISKIETGHFELENIPFNLREIVENTCEILAVRAHKKKLELAAYVHPNASIRVKGDPYRLRQVLINLVGNAIKFTEEGQVVVEVQRNPLHTSSILFSVTDTGIGIPLDKQENIFESFAQVDSSTTRKYGGTGLGLAISTRLVEMMGGGIGVDSEYGKGSRFFFDIVLEFLREDAQNVPGDTLDLKGTRALVVDDHPTNRLIVSEMLTEWGAHVVEADNGEQAIHKLKSALEAGEPYQLLMLDRLMPEMDGFEVADRLKQDPKLANACVLMLTSDFGPGDIARSRKLGIRRYLVKPVKREELRKVIDDALMGPSTAKKAAEISAAARELPASRVLLVEDSEPNQSVVEAFLKGSPVQIDIAGNGSTGLEKFKKNTYHLVLMDIQMPVMDGLTATREIRNWEKENNRPHTPIVAMTAHALVGDRKKSVDAGCDDHLAKPIKRKNFLDTVSKYLKITAGEGGLPGQQPSPGLAISGENSEAVYVDPILKPYVPGFLKSLDQLILDIADYLEQEDFDKIRAVGHRMKGDGGTYGFDDVATLGAAIQIAARERKADEIRLCSTRLTDYLKCVDIRVERRETGDEG